MRAMRFPKQAVVLCQEIAIALSPRLEPSLGKGSFLDKPTTRFANQEEQP